MPSFIKDIRRLSRGNFKSEKPNGTPSDGSSDLPPVPSNKSTSTLNTGLGTSTPPTLPSDKSSGSNGAPPVPPRPPLQHPSQNARYSIVGASSQTLATANSASTPRPAVSSSPYAPRVHTVSDGSWVHQKILLVYGQVGESIKQSIDGQVWVCHHMDSFPATPWPVNDSHFKALVHLQPGPNRLRFDLVSPKVPSPTSSPSHSSWININYLPLNAAPPLDLVILLGRDSSGAYDAVPERKNREGNGLEMAIKKFKMAAYLWQAFTGEQMQRNAFGRRCFRYDEEWQLGSLSSRDAAMGQMRNEAKIHVVRSSKTVAELRDKELAQQNHGPKAGELYGIAADAVRSYFQPKPGQKRYVSVLLLDAHWDPGLKLIRGHAALGGAAGDLQLGIFGAQALQSYPASLEEVPLAFADCTRTDTHFVADDCNESGSNWEAANIGIGAHLHETGHLFGCPHQASGVMARDYVRFNRTFTCREPYSTRTKSPGQRLCLHHDECTWHRLDCLRFKFHPCFRLPSDPTPPADDSVQVWTVDSGNVLVTAPTGIAFIEIYGEGDDVCRGHLEYVEGATSNNLPKQLTLNENELRTRLPTSGKGKKKIKLEIFSSGLGSHVVEDFGALSSKASRVKLADGRTGFKGSKLGYSQLEGTRAEEVLLWYATDLRKLLMSVRVYHGMALDGIEFIYEDSTTQMFGKKGGEASEFAFDTRRGESIIGFYLRAGLWIDGIQILTSLGRKSGIFGNANGGSGHTLIPPRGYNIAGISGSCGQFVDGFQVIITR